MGSIGMTPAKLTLGPVLFHWQPGAWRDFYFRIADEADVDTVCIGEVVCSKRLPFLTPLIPDVIARLKAAGKEVVLSSLALIMSERELADATTLAADGICLIEANDVSLVALLEGRDFTIGPLVNVYNEATLGTLEALGAIRVCLPAELPEARIAALAAAAKADLEVQAFGRLPLTISARCYAARTCNLAKDGCRFVCGEYPDGMAVETLDEVPFLATNGTQTLSYRYADLLAELPRLRALGIHRFRLSPQRVDMVAVAAVFRTALNDAIDAAEADDQLRELCPDAEFANGYFHGQPGHAFVEGD